MQVARFLAWTVLASVFAWSSGLPLVGAESGTGRESLRISAGKKVTLELTLALADHVVVFSNVGAEPLTITQGADEVVQGLQTALEGLRIGDRKQVTVPPSEGFGAVLSQNFQEVPKEQIPSDLLKEGAELQGDGPHGQQLFFRISQIKTDTVILDFNHPLAGKTLVFDVTVLDIQE